MRKICLKIHRWLGLAFGVIISIICLTGAVIVFQDEIKEAVNADIRHVEDKGEGRYLTDEALIDAIRRHTVEGLTLKSIQMPSNADEPAYAQYALSVVVTAPFYLTKLFAPYFAEGAAIVNISSSRDT